MEIVLASQSKYRKKILEEHGYTVTADPSNSDEDSVYSEGIEEHVIKTAQLKAYTVAPRHPKSLIVAIDTMVCYGREHIGKPEDYEDAKRILRMLSGHMHEVYSGVCVINTGTKKEVTGSCRTAVYVKRLSENDLEEYLKTKLWQGVAAGYSMKTEFARFVDRIEGSWLNIEGIPIETVMKLIEEVE